MEVHACIPSTQDAGIQFDTSLGYTVRPYLRKAID